MKTRLAIIMMLSIFESHSQKLMFKEDYQAIADVDNNNWNKTLIFKRGDIVTFLSLAKSDLSYYKIKSDAGIAFVYNSVVTENDNFFEDRRKKMDSLNEFVLTKSVSSNFKIKKGDTVKIIAAKSGMMGQKIITIMSGNEQTELVANDIELRKPLQEYIDYLIEQEDRKEKLKDEKALNERNKRIKTKYGEAVFNRLKKGEAWVGMTKELLIEIYGKPIRINTTENASTVREQWVYEHNRYFYFVNGKLTSWQY